MLFTEEAYYTYFLPEDDNVIPDYLMNADAFLKEATSNQFYMMIVQEFLNKSKNNINWVIVDTRQSRDYFQGHIKVPWIFHCPT